MKIKTRVMSEPTTVGDDYPCIKVSPEGRVVLFTGKKTGIFLHGTSYDIGERSDMWAEDCFKPLHGSVTLSNE